MAEDPDRHEAAKHDADAALRRPGQVQPLARVVARVAGPALKKRGLTRAELIVDWPRIVGSHFALHTSPVKLAYPRGRGEGGILHLTVAPALATAVQHDAPRLIERINAYVGHAAIARLKLVGAAPHPAPERARPPAPPRRTKAGPAVAALAEGPLREALARLERHLPETRQSPITRL